MRVRGLSNLPKILNFIVAEPVFGPVFPLQSPGSSPPCCTLFLLYLLQKLFPGCRLSPNSSYHVYVCNTPLKCTRPIQRKLENLPKDIKKDLCKWEKKKNSKDFPGGPVAKTPHFQCRGSGLIPGQGTRPPMS